MVHILPCINYPASILSDTWVLRMAKKWPRWQADLPMGLAPSVVLIQFLCRFGIVHNPR